MALFQRQRREDIEVAYEVSFGSERSKLIVGLGNPGGEYDLTRHNIGFYCVDALVAAENGSWSDKKTLKCQLADLKIGGTRLIIIKPQTFMNLSGESVRAVQDYFKIKNSDTVVVHDEIDVDFGRIRSQIGGGAAGHNGIKSLIQHCDPDFGRIRVGIGPKRPEQIDSADFVLQKFNKDEQGSLKALSTEVNSMLNEAIFGVLNPETRSFL